MDPNNGRMEYYLLSDPSTIINVDISCGVPYEAVVIWSEDVGFHDQQAQLRRIYAKRRAFHQEMANCYNNMAKCISPP